MMGLIFFLLSIAVAFLIGAEIARRLYKKYTVVSGYDVPPTHMYTAGDKINLNGKKYRVINAHRRTIMVRRIPW